MHFTLCLQNLQDYRKTQTCLKCNTFSEIQKTHMHKLSGTFIPGHGQLGMGGIASIDSTSRQAQIKGALPDVGALEKIPGNCHSDGSNPALH